MDLHMYFKNFEIGVGLHGFCIQTLHKFIWSFISIHTETTMNHNTTQF